MDANPDFYDDAAGIEPEAEGGEEHQPSRLLQFAQTPGDISDLLKPDELTRLGQDVVDDYERDDNSREQWKTKVEQALKVAAQEPEDAKSYPWPNAANFSYPMLTVAAQQFGARSMPAIIKGDEAVGVKVIGEAPTPPNVPPPSPQTPPEVAMQAAQALQSFEQRNAKWEQKNARAKRVKTYLNYKLFYGMDGWEDDTDALLNQIPITGTGFRKVYYDADRKTTCSEFVSALHLTVDMNTRDLQKCPRITQDFPLYPYEIAHKTKVGLYRSVDLNTTDGDEQKPRIILEQHRLEDLDDDGVFEPYIVTVDKETRSVLRIEAAFGPDDIEAAEGKVTGIRRWVPFVRYPFLPDPKGRFYAIGFGHLLGPITALINTTLNELIDAGNAQNAGGGFIASGLRLQGAGQNARMTFAPNEYKVVNVPGNDIRAAIWERTVPQVSPVLFQLLDLMLGAAKEIASVKDVLTGEAPATAPVGTTLALIEQGLQGYTAIFKRIWRALKEEYRLIYECEARYGVDYGDPEEYAEVTDDPEADFAADFSLKGHDIVPVSDPSVVTKMQRVAKSQMVLQILETPAGQAAGLDPQAVVKRVLEDADIETGDLFQKNPQPNPAAVADVELKQAQTKLALAQADKAHAEARATGPKAAGSVLKDAAAAGKAVVDAHTAAHMAPHQVANTRAQTMKAVADTAATISGGANGPDAGGTGGMEGASGDAMGSGGAGEGGGGPTPEMVAGLMGGGTIGADAPYGAENQG